jgi:hypothetical protein
MPNRLLSESHTEEVNWLPLSEVICCGTPNLATQPLTKAVAQDSAEVERRGMASAYLVDLSRIVRRCVSPLLEDGRGPTKSIWRWLNRWMGLLIA